MTVTMEHLRCFQAAAEALNFSKAAEACYITQPALSRTISALEKELGVRLFERSTRRVTLTPQGELCLRRASRILAEYDRLREELREGGIQELRIGFNTQGGPPPWFLTAVKALRAEHPGLKVSLRPVASRESVFQVARGELDCALIYERSAALTQGLSVERLTSLSRWAVVSTAHPLAEREHIHLKDLSGETLVFLKGLEPVTYREFRAEAGSQGLSSWPEAAARDLSELLLQVEVNGSVGITGHWPHHGENVRFLPLEELSGEGPDHSLALCWREDAATPLTEGFREKLREALK